MDWTLGILVDPPTRTISSIYPLARPESLRTISRGGMHFLNKSMHSSSNLALEMAILKSFPSARASHSIGA